MFWLNLQTANELAMAEEALGERIAGGGQASGGVTRASVDMSPRQPTLSERGWGHCLVGDPRGVVLEFKFASHMVASKRSMTDRRRTRRAEGDPG